MEAHRSEHAAPARTRERSRSAPAELEWIRAREAAARDEIRRAVVGLGHDLGRALHVPRKSSGHPLVRIALEHAGQALGSDLVLDRIESGAVRMGAIAMARSSAMAGASAWIKDLVSGIERSKPAPDDSSQRREEKT